MKAVPVRKISRCLMALPWAGFWMFMLPSSQGEGILHLPPAVAQPIVPAADGTNTVVTTNGNQFDISGGQVSGDGNNLFHSLQRFGLGDQQIANFLATPNLQNILTRITGGEASVVNGLIRMTGGSANLYLINPAGVMFGQNARLDVPGSFLVTTATGVGFGEQLFSVYGTADYANLVGAPTAFVFGTSQPGTVVNAGDLSVGMGQSLTLLGGTVVNTGTLRAPGGTVNVMAIPGNSLVRVSQPGNLLSLELDAESWQEATTDTAEATDSPGTPALALPDLLTGLGETAPATGLTVNELGQVVLTSSQTPLPIDAGTTLASGTLDVTAETAGEINILGEQVRVAGATINASGDNGGGIIRIGGDWQGQGTIPTAKQTQVDQHSTITADALLSGDGGRVVIWADESTTFHGHIQAQGHQAGGMVEVSGKETLQFQGQVDTAASNGTYGTLLLDPINIRIVAGERSADDPDILTDNQVLSRDSWAGSFTLSEGALESLASSSNVILEASNDIIIEPLSDRQLVFARGTRSITFRADADGDGNGSFWIDPVNRIFTQGADLNITAAEISVGDVITEGGSLTLRSTHQGGITTGVLTTDHRNMAGDVSLTSNRTITAAGISTQGRQGGNVNLNAYEAINVGGIKTTGDLQSGNIFAITGTGTIDSTSLTTQGGFDTSSATGRAGTVHLKAAENLLLNQINATGLMAGGNIRLIAENLLTVEEMRTSTGTLHLTSNDLEFRGGEQSISGNTLVIEPFSDQTPIHLNSSSVSGALNLSLTDLDALQDGFESITIGSENSKSNLFISGTLTWQDPLILSTGGNLEIQGSLIGEGNASFSLNAQGQITANSLTTEGQPIFVISKAGDIRIRQNIQTSAPDGLSLTTTLQTSNTETVAGDIYLEALQGNLTAGTIIANGVNGAQIELVAGENLIVGAISAQGIDQGGEIKLAADQTLTAGYLDVSSTLGDGGRITLTGTEMQLTSLNAQGAKQGGNIQLEAGQSIRLTERFTDRNQVQASISATGGERSGTITLRHQNDCSGIRCNPAFTVGDPSQNGSAGAITNGSQTLVTPTSVSSSVQLVGGVSSPTPTNSDTPINPSEPQVPRNNPGEGVTPGESDLNSDSDSPSDSSLQPPSSDKSNLPLTGEEQLNPSIPVVETPQSERTNSDVALTETGAGTDTDPQMILETDSSLESALPGEINNGLLDSTGFSVSDNTNPDGNNISPPSLGAISLEDAVDHQVREFSPRFGFDGNSLLESVTQLDQYRGQQFSNYFGDQIGSNRVTQSSIRETFSQISHLTNVKPAIIYISVQPSQLELRLFLPNGQSVFKSVPVKRAEALEIAQEFSRQVRNPLGTRDHNYRDNAQKLYQLMIQPLLEELQTAQVNTLMFSMDSGLRSLPLAAIYDGQKFLVEDYSIALIPSLSLTDTRYVEIKNAKVLAMGASEFPSDLGQSPLPAVPLELSNIVGNLWPGVTFLNQDFTLANLKAQRREPHFKIIHLATHGEFHPGGADQSYIQLWDTKLKLNQLRELKLSEPQVELLVLSACTTAVGDQDAELGFAGLAVQAGVKSALASLWYISDAGTLGLMTEFYQNLRQGEIKAAALRQAQLALLQGKIQFKNGELQWQNTNQRTSLPTVSGSPNRDLSHPYYWAAFTMIGSPW